MSNPKNRSLDPESKPDDRVDNALRPQKLNDLIGQDQVKENLSILIAAARQRGEALDHVLFYGPPGLGKTTLATVIANELGVNMKLTSGPVIQIKGELTAILTNLQDKGFIRRAWNRSRSVELVPTRAGGRTLRPGLRGGGRGRGSVQREEAREDTALPFRA